jgi:serine/threonine-protein kinase
MAVAGPESQRREEEKPGRIIAGKYELQELIGQGGMGRVWLAHNQALDTRVAIKLIRPDLLAEETTERLLREARATARINHASVVRVFDFGTDEGQPYIVMEVLEGEPLSRLLEVRGRLPATNAVSLLLPVASALVAAHSRGVVHRDLKPENVVLTKDERGRTIPKVVDFGVARLEPSARAGATPRSGLHDTRGAVVGTPDYMSPEQARGRKDVDARTDVWAFAVLLYECITGKRPFSGENYNALLSAICGDDPIPTTLHLAGDAELWDLIQKGLAKDREKRWETMRDFGSALAFWAVDRGLTGDSTGTALEEEWLGSSPPSALSDRPPPMDSGRRSRISIDTLGSASAPSLPSIPAQLVSVPAPAPSRLRSWVPLAVVFTAAGGLVAGLLLRQPAPPAPPSPTASPATASPPPRVVVSVITVPSPSPSQLPPEPSASSAPDLPAPVRTGPGVRVRASASAGPKPSAPVAPPAIPDRPDF